MFFAYAIAEYEREQRTALFRTYVADSLHFIPQGQFVSMRLGDLAAPRPEIDVDAIVDGIASRLGGDKK